MANQMLSMENQLRTVKFVLVCSIKLFMCLLLFCLLFILFEFVFIFAEKDVILPLSLSPVELHSLVIGGGAQSPLIIDVRSTDQHSQSELKMKDVELIWIPGEKLKPGFVTSRLTNSNSNLSP